MGRRLKKLLFESTEKATLTQGVAFFGIVNKDISYALPIGFTSRKRTFRTCHHSTSQGEFIIHTCIYNYTYMYI